MATVLSKNISAIRINLRRTPKVCGNSTDFKSITTVKPGATFDYVATAANGWNAIVVGKQVGWVSGKYSKVV